jgi:hypothetical protein
MLEQLEIICGSLKDMKERQVWRVEYFYIL